MAAITKYNFCPLIPEKLGTRRLLDFTKLPRADLRDLRMGFVFHSPASSHRAPECFQAGKGLKRLVQ
jgi:hypothetical protein